MRRLVRQPAQVLPQARREGAELLESLFVFRVSSLPVPAPETVRETTLASWVRPTVLFNSTFWRDEGIQVRNGMRRRRESRNPGGAVLFHSVRILDMSRHPMLSKDADVVFNTFIFYL